MPLHDFWCSACGQVQVDVYVPVEVGAREGAPDHCHRKMSPIPAAPALHYGDVKTAAFKSFDTTDGRGNPVHVDSLPKLRRIERDAEIAHRNGEGQPMVWRHYAQGGSNRDAPTLSKSYDGGEHPTAQAKHRFGSTLQKSAEEPEGRAFGPGVNESNASALPMSSK